MALYANPVSDDAYGAGWNGVTNVAPSKNAVYDKIETLGGSGADTALSNLASVQIDSNLKFIDDATPTTWEIGVDAQGTADTEGNSIKITSGDGNGTEDGGAIRLYAGDGGGTDGSGGNVILLGGGEDAETKATGAEVNVKGGGTEDAGFGGYLELYGGLGSTTGGNGGTVYIAAGSAQGGDGDGGNIIFSTGAKDGSGSDGRFAFIDSTAGVEGILNFSGLNTSDKTFTFPNTTGNLVVDSATQTLTNKTMGGYLLDGTPDSDHTANGPQTSTFASGYSSAIGDLVFFGSGGKWLEVDSDAVATCNGLMGIALEAKTDTQAMLVALPGSFVRDDSWNWTVGATLYAGETLGAMQEAIPTGADAVIRVIGFAVTADVIYFNPSQDAQTTVA